jgi:hypothetical protein
MTDLAKVLKSPKEINRKVFEIEEQIQTINDKARETVINNENGPRTPPWKFNKRDNKTTYQQNKEEQTKNKDKPNRR